MTNQRKSRPSGVVEFALIFFIAVNTAIFSARSEVHWGIRVAVVAAAITAAISLVRQIVRRRAAYDEAAAARGDTTS